MKTKIHLQLCKTDEENVTVFNLNKELLHCTSDYCGVWDRRHESIFLRYWIDTNNLVNYFEYDGDLGFVKFSCWHILYDWKEIGSED